MKEVKEVNTLEDIAKICNVSASTVSRVLNNEPGISDDTRERVFDTAKKYNFTVQKRRRPISRSMVTIIIAVPEHSQLAVNPFYDMGELVTAIHGAFDTVKCHLQVQTFGDLEEQIQTEAIESDGIICAFGTLSEDTLHTLRKGRVPYLFLNRTYEGENYISCNNLQGMLTLGTYLYRQGYKKIGYLGCSDIPVNEDRYRGYLLAAHENTGTCDNLPVYTVKEIEDINQTTAEYFVENGCDAVACFNDNFAIRLIGEFQSRGISIPENMGITGFDDSPMRRIFSPSITTISLSTYDMGFLGARWLLDNITRKETRELRLEVNGSFIPGDSVIHKQDREKP